MTLLAINWFNTTTITLLGFCTVLVVLTALIFILMGFGKLMTPKVTVPKKVQGSDQKVEITEDTEFHKVAMPANATAAIAMALHLYYADIHDEEPAHITIKHIERKDTPWNSKMYGMNNLHR